MKDAVKIGKRGAMVIPVQLRKRFGLHDGSWVIAEDHEDGILIKPAVVMPIEQYSNERKAEFLLSNSIDEADYQQARQEVIKMGLDPDQISHTKAIDIF
ncbi:MAG: AbrB/MazE/SpoVT family DNA-binding domain-containing protein [Gammaproteobacteria bacterium]|nr:AbrB/MazE/SpoVT family DNA-binding domain-containing protein [Gammaproteobacteria bacterium]